MATVALSGVQPMLTLPTKYKKLWEQAGGIFVHHISARHSIRQLRKHGFDVREPAAAK